MVAAPPTDHRTIITIRIITHTRISITTNNSFNTTTHTINRRP